MDDAQKHTILSDTLSYAIESTSGNGNDFSQVLLYIKEKKKKLKVEEDFYNAFQFYIEDSKPDNYSQCYSSLAKWYLQFSIYPYRSLSKHETALFSIMQQHIDTNYPQVAKQWLKPEDLEREYGFSKSWQAKARMASSNFNLPFHKIGGKFIQYDREEIDAWIRDHKVR